MLVHALSFLTFKSNCPNQLFKRELISAPVQPGLKHAQANPSFLQQRTQAVKAKETLIPIPNASDMAGICCFWGLEWRADSCHLPAVLYSELKPPWQLLSRLVYNELDASQNVSSPNITHFRHPFQLAQGGEKAEIHRIHSE